MLRWQLLATVALAFLGGLLAGAHGALSAVLGGAISICAGGASAIVAALGGARSALGIVGGALRAEFVKVALIVGLLWLVLETYEQVVMLAFFATFFATVLIFAMAFFVREY